MEPAPPEEPAQPETEAPAPAQVQPPEPEVVAAAPGSFGKPQLAQAQRTSGTLSFEELEKRRAESYARYKARKGADAKELGPE